jgi:hypothetical protein
VSGQNQNAEVDLISSYLEYTEMDRELVYAHLNKSVYIKGETIGIKAYVLDKYTKELVQQSANLYGTISDEKGKVVERKLFMITNGIAIGDFDIEEVYTSGYYTIKLYTNWMRNFDEQSLFVETIRIIDPEVEKQMISEADLSKVDAQFLPEGGHLLLDVENTLGVIIKNNQGLGLPYVEGEITNQDGVVVTNFKANQFGIGKCVLTPKKGNTYQAKFVYADITHSIDIINVTPKGIAMRLTALRDKIALTLNTNDATFENISQDLYKLAIHNGKDLKEISFKFGETTEVVKVISNDDLFSGINIFTIFNANNNPLIERLYFNYDGLSLQTSGEQTTSIKNDSITITLPYKMDGSSNLNTVSVSVLPSGTNAFHHQNITSYMLLQPYVKGYIEQAHYYFTDITPKKQFELDNLLITQGWSSYNWDTVFKNPPEYNFDNENGISYTINSTEKGEKQLMIYPSLNHKTKLIGLTKENSSYTASGLFPLEDEMIRIREIGDDKVSKPKLYIQFDPIKIPEIESKITPLISAVVNAEAPYSDISTTNILKKVEQLDEVIIATKKGDTEIEKIKNRSLGNVEAMDETLVRRYRTLVRYLRDKGWTVADTPGKFEIYNNQMSGIRDRAVEVDQTTFVTVDNPRPTDRPITPDLDDHTIYMQNSATIPIVYLDGMILHEDLTILRDLTLDQIEWIEVNKSGVGGGMRSGGAGLIRIKTKPQSNVKVSSLVYESYEIPLKFSVAKKFYIPEYVSYESEFFNRFGVIDWFPNLKFNDNGTLEFKIAHRQLKDCKVVVEGIVNNSFVSEVKTIKLN